MKPVYASLAAFVEAWEAELAVGRETWRRVLRRLDLDADAIERVIALIDYLNDRRLTETLVAMETALAHDDGVTTWPPDHGLDQARRRVELQKFADAVRRETDAAAGTVH
jgi:hypothetical protein